MSADQFDEDYFLRGKETGKSLYENYHWMPELTIPMVQAIIDHCGIEVDQLVLDFGCARGYTVRAMRHLHRCAFGIDCSEWAITNCDQSVKDFLYCRNGGHENHINGLFDWVIAKDVLEHVPQVADVVTNLMGHARMGVFAVVPLGYGEDGYVVPEYDLDVTHIHRMTLQTWAGLFMRPEWGIDVRYRVPGVKDNYYKPGWETGNGFITARRIVE